MSTNSPATYKSIFKVTVLLGSVRVFTICMKLITNKIVAVLLGTSGIGLLGIFQQTLHLINAVNDLGISKSSVRNIAEANVSEDKTQISIIYQIFNKLLYFFSITGAILTAVFSKQLSIWSFGTDIYQWPFVALAIAVFFNSLNTGQLAVLQGLRQFKNLAKASSIGAFVGVVVSAPLFFFLREDGIVHSLIFSGLTAFIVSTFYIRKLKFQNVKILKSETIAHSKDMIRLGTSMMMVSFLVTVSGYLLRNYLSNHSGIDTVGVFHAGFTIVSSYFGLIFSAMAIDFFPRISAVNKDNQQIEIEINKQSVVILIILAPLIVLLLYTMPVFIEVLYSSEFILTIKYVNCAIFGVFFFAIGQLFGMVLLAKNNSKVFTVYSFTMQLFFLLCNIFFFNLGGIMGMGIAYSVNMLIYVLSIVIINYKLYNIKLDRRSYKLGSIVILFSTLSFFLKDIDPIWLRYISGVVLFFTSAYYTIYMLKKILEIKSFRQLLINK